jgi:hypothetical protein
MAGPQRSVAPQTEPPWRSTVAVEAIFVFGENAMKVSVAVAQIVACGTLLAFQCVGMAQTPTPTAAQPSAQPAYPSAPAPRNRVNPSGDEPTRKPEEPRCANLKGLEKAECERRDTVDDDAPAGVTSSMCEKQKETAKENAETDSAADTAKKKPATASSSSETAKPKVEQAEKQDRSSADEADTLGKPPAS